MSKNRFLVSDETVNSHGFTVKTSGIDTSRFEQNPVMLWMHERANIIGKWENIKKESGKLFADAVFDVEDPIAKTIQGKVERGFLKSASIGIGKATPNNGVVETCELFEISIVDIGSNSNAVRLYTENETTIQLKLSSFNAFDTVLKTLGLNNNTTEKQVKEELTSLLAQRTELKKVKEYQDEEAVYLIDEAIKRGLINAQFRQMHINQFKENFITARLELAELFPFKRVHFLDLVKLKSEGKGDRSKWTLNDYRMYAPKELEQNPELFNKLLSEI